MNSWLTHGIGGPAAGSNKASHLTQPNLDIVKIQQNADGHGSMFLVILAAIMMVLAACSSGSEDASPASPETNDEQSSTTSMGADESASDSTTSTALTTEPVAEPGTEAGATDCSDVQSGIQQQTIEVDASVYTVQIFVPSSADGAPLPAVINWHGLGSNGQQQVFLTDYENLAEAEGFIVAHPSGLANEDSGDARGWELEQLDVPGRDDLAMADALIDLLVSDFCAEPTRVYSTGMSNGGFFTSRLVCELSDRIAAAVSVAGLSHYDGCQPSRAVPFMAFHGTADDIVPFTGGQSTLQSSETPDQLADFFDQVMPDEFAEFAADFGCDAKPSSETVSAEVIRYDYSGCDDGIQASFIEIVDGGHTWPGSPLGPVMEDFVGKTTADIAATADGWAFMSQFSLSD